jgi:hypothetical protein
MLEDIYIAKNRNKQGQPYGFVRFSNVRDVDKLVKALNAVCFGDFRVRARVARFNRNNTNADEANVESREAGVWGTKTTVDKPKAKTVTVAEKNPQVVTQPRCETLAAHADGGLDTQKGVTEKLNGNGTQKQEVLKQPERAAVGGQDSRIYVRSYKAAPVDVDWARCGAVATIANGEAVSVVRRRLEDAGFTGLDLIHLGGARVLVRNLDGTEVLPVLDGAKDFFLLCFSHWVRWETSVIPFQRGAWVRIYGIPLHAWNCNFFKLCVMDCGRFLRSDSYTKAKDRLDYARVLIATTEMAVIKKVENLLVDGTLVVVQIVEEWGYELGDDACLLEDDTVTKASHAAEDAFCADPEAINQVDMLIDQIAKGVSDETRAQDDDSLSAKPLAGPQSNGAAGRPRDLGLCHRPEPVNADMGRVAGSETLSVSPGPEEGVKAGASRPQHQRTKSCPPAGRSGLSGPWSLEWLDAHHRGDAGVISSGKRRLVSGGVGARDQLKKAGQGQSKTKGGGFLQHSLHSLKRIARLPINDRREVLHVLQKTARKSRPRGASTRSRATGSRVSAADGQSSSSVNNDWQHWVAMQGREGAVEDDVLEMGDFVGASFPGKMSNRFTALSKPGSGKQDPLGGVQGAWTPQE